MFINPTAHLPLTPQHHPPPPTHTQIKFFFTDSESISICPKKSHTAFLLHLFFVGFVSDLDSFSVCQKKSLTLPPHTHKNSHLDSLPKTIHPSPHLPPSQKKILSQIWILCQNIHLQPSPFPCPKFFFLQIWILCQKKRQEHRKRGNIRP